MGQIDIAIPFVAPLSETSQVLSQQINTATRSPHTQLNRKIISRLPLALPPYSTNSSTYVSGLLHIAPIYITFESLWQALTEGNTADETCDGHSSTSKTSGQNGPPKFSPRVQTVLSDIQLPGLLRTARLRSDIQSLSGLSEEEVDSQLKLISQEGKLAKFVAHTKESVAKNPHVLVAYTWVLYMALFSGGRILRSWLQAAGGVGKEFWKRDPSHIRKTSIGQEGNENPGKGDQDGEARRISKSAAGLEFFHFIGDQDGEDIKVEYKRRFASLDDTLTTTEKKHIVAEAQHIFQFMLDIVSDLDALMGTNEELLQQPPSMSVSQQNAAVAKEGQSRQETPETNDSKASGFLELIKNLPLANAINLTSALPLLQTIVKPRAVFEGVGLKGVSFSTKDPGMKSRMYWLLGIVLLVLLPALGAMIAIAARYVLQGVV